MSEITDGWSVDVDGVNVVVEFPRGEDAGRRVLSRHEARVLRVQLHLAYLLAGRNRSTTGADSDATPEEVFAFKALMQDHPDLRTVDITEEMAAELLDRYKAFVGRNSERTSAGELGPESSAEARAHSSAASGVSPVTARLPRDWNIAARGQTVEFVVPASAADGHFALRIEEATAAGLALIQQAERARLAWLEARERAIEQTGGSLSGTYGPGYLDEVREGWYE